MIPQNALHLDGGSFVKMKKLFSNDVFFAVTAYISWICLLLSAVLLLFSYIFTTSIDSLQSVISNLLFATSTICLYVSYRSHSKNVMKGMMGALLGFVVMDALEQLLFLDPSQIFQSGVQLIYLVLAIALFAVHFLINMKHTPSTGKTAVFRIITVLMVIIQILWAVELVMQNSKALGTVIAILMEAGYICMILLINCVETRLDIYRQDRSEAGWTEEMGYPEGYVHEYEKEHNNTL